MIDLMNESGDLIPKTNFSKEKVQNFMADHEPLYLKHCEEVGYYKQDKPEMIWGRYMSLEEAGILRIFTIRDSSYKLIGYGIYFVAQNLHYATAVLAQCDMIYVVPEYRGGMGEKFISWIDESLKSEGVNAVSHHAKVYYDFGSMLKRLEYEHIENIYIRRLN